MSVPLVERPYLLNSTIVPPPGDLQTFLQYLTRLYEDIAFAVNARDFIYFTMSISSTAAPIPNLPLFGSFIICVSGENPGMPCLITTVCKNDTTAAGNYAFLNQQSGDIAPWAASFITVQDGIPSSNGEIPITISHSVANTPGSFNLRIIGTQ